MGRGRKFTYKKNISNEVEESDWVYTKPNGEEYDSLRLLCNN